MKKYLFVFEEVDGTGVGESQLKPPEGWESATCVAAQLEAWLVLAQVEEQ